MYTLSHPTSEILGQLVLPPSKSISNRLLILNYLMQGEIKMEGLSVSEDVKTLQKILDKLRNTDQDTVLTLNVKGSATAMRFLVPLLACRHGVYELSGDESIQNRPVDEAVCAMRSLGADIRYLKKEGYLPILINGKNIKGGKVFINPSVSSQFVSGLLLIAWSLEKGLEIDLTSEPVSRHYISLTVDLLYHLGINAEVSERKFIIKSQKPIPKDIAIEADWSAAACWYEVVAMSKKGDLHLKGLKLSSSQGDKILKDLYKDLGVKTLKTGEGIRLVKSGGVKKNFHIDFRHNPDMFPYLSVTFAVINTKATLSGLQNLSLKESDRLGIVCEYLKRMGANVVIENNETIQIFPTDKRLSADLKVDPHNDHRIAMAFAPLAVRYTGLTIDNPGVVSKSYPDFWRDMELIGFRKKAGNS